MGSNNDVMLQPASLIDCDTCVLMACGMYYTNCPMEKCLSYKIPLLALKAARKNGSENVVC